MDLGGSRFKLIVILNRQTIRQKQYRLWHLHNINVGHQAAHGHIFYDMCCLYLEFILQVRGFVFYHSIAQLIFRFLFTFSSYFGFVLKELQAQAEKPLKFGHSSAFR